MLTISAKTIVSGYRESGWFGSNYNMNIYKGCCHGCIYCDSRSECYRIENFDTVRAKANALTVIEHDLKSKRKTGIIITGSMSDPYNPFEKEYELTRGALKLIDRYGFGVAVDTKSELVVRDTEHFKSIQRHSPVAVSLTITTAEDDLCRKLEQNVCVSSKRFEALKLLSERGIPCGILLMPILPFINDTEDNIEAIIDKAYAAGAKWIYAGDGFGVTLRQNQREYFFMKLDWLFPGLKQRYIECFGGSYVCSSPDNKKLWEFFKTECDKLGILFYMEDIKRLLQKDYGDTQMSII